MKVFLSLEILTFIFLVHQIVGTKKWIYMSSSMFFKLHLWSMVSREIYSFSLWKPVIWSPLAKACFFLAPLKMCISVSLYWLIILHLLWNMFPHCTSSMEHAGLSIHLFLKGKHLFKGIIWHLQTAEGSAVHWWPIVEGCLSSLPGVAVQQMLAGPRPHCQHGHAGGCTQPQAWGGQVLVATP